MADDKITTTIKCQNIAPIENLTREIKSGSLKMGVFANNGSGKTFLSRLFRLTEKQDELILDENGKTYSSVNFANLLQKKMHAGTKQLVFLIGGPYGFSDDIYQRANEKISLSPIPFSHQIVRFIFIEQLYRALTIL